MKFGKYFEYLNKKSEQLGLYICSFEEDKDSLSLARELDQGSLNKYRTSAKIYGAKYTSTLTFKISIMKNPCNYKNSQNLVFTRKELNTITSWLTSSSFPSLFHMTNYTDDKLDDVSVDYYGVVTDIEPQFSGRFIVGLTITFQTDSPFGWSQEKSTTLTNTDTTATKNFNIIVNTAGEPYIYPTLKVTGTVSGNNTITLSNVSDNNQSVKIKAIKDYTYYIDCNRMTVRDSSLKIITLDTIGITDLGSLYWFRLINTTNAIKLVGAANIVITYKEPIKVGAY